MTKTLIIQIPYDFRGIFSVHFLQKVQPNFPCLSKTFGFKYQRPAFYNEYIIILLVFVLFYLNIQLSSKKLDVYYPLKSLKCKKNVELLVGMHNN